MKKYLLPFILLLSVSCELKWDLPSSSEPMIVVEGWIENGRPATVILTRLLPFSSEGNSDEVFDLGQLPLRWATVKLSDGENEEVLVGKYDENYVPPYVYIGSDILGEEGKTYTLSVRYPGIEVTAESTMPVRVPVERVETEANPDKPDEYSIRIHFTDDTETGDWYKVFTKINGEDTRYFPSFMNNVDDGVFLGGEGNILVNRAFRHIGGGMEEFSPYFHKDETVKVKLAHLPEDGYDFWYSYENEVTNGANILFPSNSSLKTNIHGGRGIWCAYAVDIVEVNYEP